MNLSTNEIADLTATAYHTHCNGDPDKRSLEVRKYLDHNPDFERRILQRLKSTFPWLLERSATEHDFHDFCEKEGIEVVFNKAVRGGIYVRFRIEEHISHHIFLNQNPKDDLRYVMFHEAAHYLFHEPSIRLTDGRNMADEATNQKKHIEAEIVASLCVTKANDF